MIRYIEKGDIFRIDGVSSYAHARPILLVNALYADFVRLLYNLFSQNSKQLKTTNIQTSKTPKGKPPVLFIS